MHLDISGWRCVQAKPVRVSSGTGPRAATTDAVTAAAGVPGRARLQTVPVPNRAGGTEPVTAAVIRRQLGGADGAAIVGFAGGSGGVANGGRVDILLLVVLEIGGRRGARLPLLVPQAVRKRGVATLPRECPNKFINLLRRFAKNNSNCSEENSRTNIPDVRTDNLMRSLCE